MALKDLEKVKDEIALQEKKVGEARKGSSYYILKKEEAILEGLKAKYEICSAALEYQEQIASEAYEYISNELEELLKELKDVKESLPESIKIQKKKRKNVKKVLKVLLSQSIKMI